MSRRLEEVASQEGLFERYICLSSWHGMAFCTSSRLMTYRSNHGVVVCRNTHTPCLFEKNAQVTCNKRKTRMFLFCVFFFSCVQIFPDGSIEESVLYRLAFHSVILYQDLIGQSFFGKKKNENPVVVFEYVEQHDEVGRKLDDGESMQKRGGDFSCCKLQ